MLTDHVRIRHLVERLSGEPDAPPETLRELGERLERHVRLEERELFPLIEASLPEPELQRMATALS